MTEGPQHSRLIAPEDVPVGRDFLALTLFLIVFSVVVVAGIWLYILYGWSFLHVVGFIVVVSVGFLLYIEGALDTWRTSSGTRRPTGI